MSGTTLPAPRDGAQVAYIGLGANLGDLQASLQSALQALAAQSGVEVQAVSPGYRSAPVEAQGPDYLNAVACLRTTLAPLDLLDVLQAIESAHGRERPYVNAPRTLDLDLLLYGTQTLCHERLTVPHPRLHLRAFVLRPLLDLAPDLQVAGLGPLAMQLPVVAQQAIARWDRPLWPGLGAEQADV